MDNWIILCTFANLWFQKYKLMQMLDKTFEEAEEAEHQH